MYTFHKKGHSCPQTVLELEIKWKNRTTLVSKKQQHVKNVYFYEYFVIVLFLYGFHENIPSFLHPSWLSAKITGKSATLIFKLCD